MGISVVRIHQKCHEEAVFQISSRLVIRNPIKIDPVLHPGVGSLSDEVYFDGHLDGQDPSEML